MAGGNPVNIRWRYGDKKNYHSTSDFAGFVGGNNNIIEDPLFEDAVNYSFKLLKDSPAIDAGILHEAYDTYFDIHGVDNLYDARIYQISWNGKDQNNRQVVTGIYFYLIITDEQVLTRKMLLIR